MNSLPAAGWLLGDRGCDADWFREALVDMGISPCIPGQKLRDKKVKYDKRRYKRRKRLAARGRPLRQMPGGLPLRHHYRCTRNILVMSSEPNKCELRYFIAGGIPRNLFDPSKH